MNITQMIQDGEPAVAAAVAALVDPAIQPDALRMAAVDLARQQADEIERLRAELAELRDQKPVARAEQVGEQVVARWLTSDHAMVCPAGTLLYAAPATAGPAGWKPESGCPQWAHGHNIPLYLSGPAGKLFRAVGAYWVDGVLSVATEQKDAGWQLVPVEPTIGMCIAGDGARVNVDDATRTPAIYRAMLAAAPKGGE